MATFPRDAFEDETVGAVATLLHDVWDPSGRLAAAAARRRDPSAPRSYDDFALVLCGMAAAGASQAAVLGYLRREEEALAGAAVTTGHERGAVARGVWRAVGRR
jgi:hypothetical protein